jgi:hypothetical protein
MHRVGRFNMDQCAAFSAMYIFDKRLCHRRWHLAADPRWPVDLTAPTLFSPKSNGPNVDNQRQGGSLGLKR